MDSPVELRPRRELTPSQQLIWTSQRLSPDRPIANMATLTRFAWPLDPGRFVAAVHDVVTGSDALRTIVAEIEGMPHPRVLARPPVETEVLDLDPALLDEWTSRRIEDPIDVGSAVYDSVLLNLGDEGWAWWMNIHHLATDAASSALIFNSVADAYHGDPRPPTSYAEVAAEIDEARSTPRWQAAMSHWQSVEVATAPTEMYRPDSGPSTSASRVHVEMNRHRQSRLDSLLGGDFRLLSADLSLTAALATAIFAYLHRLNAATTLTIGMPVHHRSTRRSKAVIGPLVELFPVSVEIDSGETFITLQKKVASAIFDALKYAQPGTSPRQEFDVVLNVHGATFGSFGDIEAHTTWIHPGHIDSHHRLRVQALDYDGSGQLELALDINHRIADDDHRRRAGGHFASVLDAMLADPERPLASVCLVGDDELALLDSLLTDEGTPLDAPAPELIARTLRREGARPVLVQRDLVLTREELDRRIDSATGRLVRAGIGRGDVVAIEMTIGVDAVIAIHAVLRAGAAFVPIDPEYPESRRDHLRSDCGATLCLTLLDEIDDLHPVDPDATAGSIDEDDLAYIIYTSGSTGPPKGVPITHRGLSEYLGFAHQAYVADGVPVMPLYTSLSFDLTITTLFLPLLAGGVMTVHPEGGLVALREIVDDRRANLMKATPSHLELLARMIDSDHPLRAVVVGGEAFMTDLADRLIERCAPGLSLYNEYGPTEAVVGCMIHRYDPVADPGPEVPIGLPAPGVGLHVLDEVGLPVPLGVSGELYISRPGLSDGYLGLPELTGEKFLLHNGRRLYRTGDRVRMLDIDRMVFLGRIDEQIKVGGIRLEPGEIEAVARSVDGVCGAVVRLWVPEDGATPELCVRCGLGSDVPDITVDDEGVCSACRDYDAIAAQADAWFRTEDDLLEELAEARARSTADYDVVHLLSGGKDSTYALYRLVEMGARVFSLTLDNGYISDGAKDNVRRATAALGVDHEFITVDGMDEIFRDSLQRYSNVCNGCYKAIYTVALQRANDMGIAAIVTGLSRGQFFETRLVPGLFGADRFDPDAIDGAVAEARRVYHATEDAVSENLDVSFIADSGVLERVRFIDFYRYVDVELTDMYAALESSGTWRRPTDTGRSTNCLINAAGIFVHKIERGHHNYALPYSWDVRLGHKTRAEAIDELDDPMDDSELASITSMLAEVGYEPRRPELLTLWVESDPSLDLASLRRTLAAELPVHARPRAVEIIDRIPLTPNGKVDSRALPAPAARRLDGAAVAGRAPGSPTERLLADVWSSVLSLNEVSATDEFFALGGTSLHALEMIVRASKASGVTVPEAFAFRHRTIAQLAEAIDTLSPDSDSRVPDIPPLPEGEVPMSVGEESMLYEWRRDHANARYNVGRLFGLPSGFDRGRFDEAVRRVVAHQPTLRTSYGAERRELTVDEALGITAAHGESESIDELADRLNKQRFDLVSGPLVTVHHLTSDHPDDRNERAVLISTHHISVDAGSLEVMWHQIDAAYQGRSLPDTSATYAEHAAWQREHRADPAGAWQPEGELGKLAIRAERPTPDGYVSRDTSVTASRLRSSVATTPFAAALTALAAGLEPYFDDSLFEIAVTATTRDHPDMADVVGLFLNPLPLLIDVQAAGTGAQLASRMSSTLADSLQYRSVPFADIVRSARARGIDEPLSRVMLAVVDLAAAELDGSPVRQRILSSGSAANDLTFFVQIQGERLELGCEYRGSVVDRSQAERLLEAFAHALERLIEHPHDPIVVTDDGATDLVGPPLRSGLTLLPAAIDRSIASHPGLSATRCGTEVLSYAELDQKAREVGARLRAMGVKPGDRVAVVVPRSIHLPVAILGSWMIGASYVPIDIDLPPARVAALVAAAGVRVAVTAGDGHAGLTEVPTIAADLHDPAVLALGRLHETQASDEAYTIFTSGSTGRPKGVPISHENLRASVAARLDWYGEKVERYLLMSSPGFDSSVAGLFWALADGGELLIPDESEVHDVDALLELIRKHAPSHMLCVPSLYGALLQREGAGLPSLRTTIVAGEACSKELVERHHALGSRAKLVNEYGPTEATVWASAQECVRNDPRGTVPIGAPIPGVLLRVADRNGGPSPVDVAGELWISGPTVARGYLHESDDSTAFGTDAEGRWFYRTGDRVVRRADGVLEYLGRLDEQLSLGGVRIEPAEIEQALASFEGVHEAAAGERNGRLLAWMTAEPAVDASEIRSELSRRLPPTHVPAAVVVVEHLPRTSNGKLDRSRIDELPGPEVVAELTEAGDPVVQELMQLWSSVFDGVDVGADSDFFSLGGDSLRAVELVSLVEESFGERVAIGELIDAPTPAALASRVRAEVDRSGSGLIEWLRVEGDAPPLVVLPPGGGNLLRYAPLVGELDQGIPVVGIRLPGADARSEIVHTVEEQAKVMLDALDDVVDSGPYRLLGWSTGGLIAWHMARLLTERGDEVEIVVLVDTFMSGIVADTGISPAEKYAGLLRDDGVKAVLDEGFGRLRERTEFALARRRYRRAREQGDVPAVVDAERELGPVIRRATLAFQPEPLELSILYFSATDSDPDLTVNPWIELQRGVSELDVVSLDGSHFVPEERCIIGPHRIVELVAALTDRLGDSPASS